MADYPSAVQVYGSSQRDSGGFSTTRSVSGALKIRSFYSSDVRQLSVVHEVDDTGKTELENFYTTNRKLPFNIVWAADGLTYTCRFLKPMQYKPIPANRWQVTAMLEVI